MGKKEILIRMKRELEKKITVEQLYLFGSRARGTHFKESDYDIAVVSSEFRKMSFFERQRLVRPLIRKVLGDVPIDVVCYTPEEFSRGRKAFLPSVIEKEGIRAV